MRFHVEIPSGAADVLADRHDADDAAEVVTDHVRGLVRQAVHDHVNAQQTSDRMALREDRNQQADNAADGVLVAPEWEQPEGGHDAYQVGDIVFHDGQFWECTDGDADGNNVWEPGEFGWAPLGDAT